MAQDTDREIDLYDIADWLWSYRLLAFTLAAIGAIAAVALWAAPNAVAPSYQGTFTVYTSGTPVRSDTEIVEMLSAQIASEETGVTSALGKNPLVVDFASPAAADNAQQAAAALELSLVAEVEERQEATRPLVGSNENALNLNLEAGAFLSAHRSGLIRTIQAEMTEAVAARSARNSVLVVVLAGFAFFALASAHSFWTHWQARRAVRQADGSRDREHDLAPDKHLAGR